MGIEENGLIDAHLHLQDERLREHLLEIVEVLRKENVTWWGVNGTSPSDWEEVADLADSYSEVYPFFGVHPRLRLVWISDRFVPPLVSKREL